MKEHFRAKKNKNILADTKHHSMEGGTRRGDQKKKVPPAPPEVQVRVAKEKL